MFAFHFVRSEVHHALSLSRYPFTYVFGIVSSQALNIQLVNSVVASFLFLERSMVSFLSTLYLTYVLFADCTTVFSILLIVGQYLRRGSILWCYDHCWFHSAVLPIFQLIFLSLNVSMLDALPMYPWYVDGCPGSFATWIQDFIIFPR